jgi:hypothetical protein
MKTKLLRRLREENRIKHPYMLLLEFALSLGWSLAESDKYIREKRRRYILRRVAELKQKRKMKMRIYVVNRWRDPGCGHFILLGLSKFWFGPSSYKLSVHLFGIEIAAEIDRINKLSTK